MALGADVYYIIQSEKYGETANYIEELERSDDK